MEGEPRARSFDGFCQERKDLMFLIQSVKNIFLPAAAANNIPADPIEDWGNMREATLLIKPTCARLNPFQSFHQARNLTALPPSIFQL